MSVGGASVNSLCQQGGLFALSVNRHSDYFNSSLSFYMNYTLEVHRSRQYILKYGTLYRTLLNNLSKCFNKSTRFLCKCVKSFSVAINTDCATHAVFNIVHPKMKPGENVYTLIHAIQNRFGYIYHCITCSPVDYLQWMGAVRMRVQTADKYITIIHKKSTQSQPIN